MFVTGAYDLKMDEKKRLFIPVAVRAAMHPDRDGTRLYVVLGEREGTLALYPDRCFRRYAKRLATEMVPGDDQEIFDQVFYSQCAELEIDAQGRIVLPDHLVKAVNLGRSVVLTGARTHLLLWNKDHYDEFIAKNLATVMERQRKARRDMAQSMQGSRAAEPAA